MSAKCGWEIQIMQNEMVLLHGWGMNQGVWQVIKPELEFFHDGEVRCLDLPGFGNAQSIPIPYTLHAAAEQLSTQLNDQSILVGWSLGGLFALYIAAHWPDKVAKVVLVASTPFFAQTDE